MICDGALESFAQGLAIAKALARRDPDNLQWQWDLSTELRPHRRRADRGGKLEEALAAIGAASPSPRAAGATRHVGLAARSRRQLPQDRLARGAPATPSEARELLEKGRAIIARLDRIAAHQAQWRSDLSRFDAGADATACARRLPAPDRSRSAGWRRRPTRSTSRRRRRHPGGRASASASAITPAVTPEPQEATTGLPASTPAAAKIARSSASAFSVPSALSSVANGTLREPGMWPERRPAAARARVPSKRRGGARIDDLRRLAADQRLDLGGVAHEPGIEARREMALACAARRLAVLQRPALRLPFLQAAVEHRARRSWPMARNIHHTRAAE